MTKTVACLAGDGVGPELMAAATRALDRVAKLHSFDLDDRHLPFAGEAVTRSGHPLPASTRAAYRDADAILVASPHEPAFDGVKADLQLSWRVVRVDVGPTKDIVVAGPVDEWANETAVAHAFACAASRRGRIVCVGDSPTLARRRRAREDGVGRAPRRAGDARRDADPAARRLGVARRRRHRDASRRRARRCSRVLCRLERHGRTGLASRRGARRLRSRRQRARRGRRLRRRRPEGDAARDVADARRGSEAAGCVADARAGGRLGRHRAPVERRHARSPTR